MKEVKIENSEEIESIDDLFHLVNNDGKEGNASFTAAVVSDSLTRLFPEEGELRKLMMVTNLRNDQLVHVIKALYSPKYMGLDKETLGHRSIYENRVMLIEDYMRGRVSINRGGRNDVVKSLGAIMLNELQRGAQKINTFLGKGV